MLAPASTAQPDSLMTITLPCAAVFVMLFGFGCIATGSANKNPQLTFFNLNAVKGGFFFGAAITNFSFHLQAVYCFLK